MEKIRITVEFIKDGEIYRKLVETSEIPQHDITEATQALGYSLSKVAAWWEQGCGDGESVLASMAFHTAYDSPWGELARMHKRWNAGHDFVECVTVTADEAKLTCGGECASNPPRPCGSWAIEHHDLDK